MSNLEALRQVHLSIIDRYDVQLAQLRALEEKPVKTSQLKPNGLVSFATFLPVFWAVFQLSGDWR